MTWDTWYAIGAQHMLHAIMDPRLLGAVFCLDVSGGSAEPEANIQQWECAGVPQQYWQMIVTSF